MSVISSAQIFLVGVTVYRYLYILSYNVCDLFCSDIPGGRDAASLCESEKRQAVAGCDGGGGEHRD